MAGRRIEILEIIRKRRAFIGRELRGDTGAQPVFVVGAILVLEVAVAVAGAAGESRHRGKRPPPSQAGLVEFFVTLGAAFVGSCKGGQPDGVAPALMGGAQPERARARRLVLEGEGIVLVERLRSEEHTSELQSLMRISYAVFS